MVDLFSLPFFFYKYIIENITKNRGLKWQILRNYLTNNVVHQWTATYWKKQ